MAERLALGVIPGVGWSAEEIQTIAREAEEARLQAKSRKPSKRVLAMAEAFKCHRTAARVEAFLGRLKVLENSSLAG